MHALSHLPLLSIVTPSFNQGSFIAEAIDSVLSQDYPHIECLVIDGGSRDSTLEALRQYGGRLYWISEPDHGQSHALNKGWRMAQGEILGWLNSDDTYRPGALQAIANAFQLHPEVGGIYGDCDYISATGEFLEKYETGPFDFEIFFRTSRSPIPQPSMFIRRTVYEHVGPVNEDLRLVMDWEYWLRLGMQYPILYLPRTLATYRVHGSSKSATESLRYGEETTRVYREMFANPNLPAALQRYHKESMNNVLLQASKYAFDGAQLQEARHYLLEGWKIRPFHIRRFMPKIFVVSFLGRRGWNAWMRFRRWRGAKLGVFETQS
jgi:glycosyltransferase involved in cell wall biosynthesis